MLFYHSFEIFGGKNGGSLFFLIRCFIKILKPISVMQLYDIPPFFRCRYNFSDAALLQYKLFRIPQTGLR
nr:MAG TPA: hypothetical protein [Caudoviricetes sp.]